MSFIYMDESGCLGFDFNKSRTSQYFIITFLFCNNKRPLEKIVKKIFQIMPENHRRKHCGVLHCHKENVKIRQKIFTELKTKNDISIMTIKLNKAKIFSRFHEQKHMLYNYATNILLDRILTKNLIPSNTALHLIASRRETKHLLNESFRNEIRKNLIENHDIDITIEIKTPQQEKGLQIVDAASWALFQKYEHGDESYYNIFKEIIVEENTLFD